ncbi:unnamed protein product [Amoebophrya sp. A25]|nr:unnamed protein product [Amoebophrya sp. A25]|eukprot:GSA25T00005962001.1
MSAGRGGPGGPAAGAAAASLATNPYAQSVGRDYAASAARGAAGKAKAGMIELKLYVQENPTSVRVALLCSAALLALFSFIGIISVFALFNPQQLLINLYNLLFAIVVIILEGKEGWCGGLQRRLYEKAAFLSNGCGKGGFILYVGTMIFCVDLETASTFWAVMYVLLGIMFCGLGLIQIQQSSCPGCCRGDGHRRFNDDQDTAAGPGPVQLDRANALTANRASDHRLPNAV